MDDTSMQLLTVRNARLATAVALASLVGFLASPSAVRPAVVVVMVASCLAVVVCAAAWMRTPAGSRGVGATAVASAVGLVGSLAYLSSLADEPAAIPLAGTGVLLLSLAGLVVSLFTLHER